MPKVGSGVGRGVQGGNFLSPVATYNEKVSALAGDPLTVDKELFNSYSGGSHQWNTSRVFPSLYPGCSSYLFVGYGPGALPGDNPKGYCGPTLITEKHAVAVSHSNFYPRPGTTVTFKSPTNGVGHTTTVDDVLSIQDLYGIASHDITIVRLTDPAPSDYVPKLATNDMLDVFRVPTKGQSTGDIEAATGEELILMAVATSAPREVGPVFVTISPEKYGGGFFNMRQGGSISTYDARADVRYPTIDLNISSGDSGNPVFLVDTDDSLVLLGMWDAPGQITVFLNPEMPAWFNRIINDTWGDLQTTTPRLLSDILQTSPATTSTPFPQIDVYVEITGPAELTIERVNEINKWDLGTVVVNSGSGATFLETIDNEEPSRRIWPPLDPFMDCPGDSILTGTHDPGWAFSATGGVIDSASYSPASAIESYSVNYPCDYRSRGFGEELAEDITFPAGASGSFFARGLVSDITITLNTV